MQAGLNSVSMAVGVMQKALYSSYTQCYHRSLKLDPDNSNAARMIERMTGEPPSPLLDLFQFVITIQGGRASATFSHLFI